jgi:hypothetical protein
MNDFDEPSGIFERARYVLQFCDENSEKLIALGLTAAAYAFYNQRAVVGFIGGVLIGMGLAPKLYDTNDCGPGLEQYIPMNI